MSKSEPISKKSSSPKNDTPSESGSLKPDELDISSSSLADQSSEESNIANPGSTEKPETKNEDIGPPLMQLEDEGDWAEESKFVIASQTTQDETVREHPVILPAAYGYPRLVFLIRDPYWMFAFWEIPPENAHQLLAKLQRSWDQVHWALRMYSPSKENATDENTWDTAIDPSAPGWYLHLSPPGTSFQGEIGLCDETGRYVGLVCSNIATLPPDRPSPFVDEQWPITKTDHETHYAGLPKALQQVSTKDMSPELIEQWQASRPASRPNPFGKD